MAGSDPLTPPGMEVLDGREFGPSDPITPPGIEVLDGRKFGPSDPITPPGIEVLEVLEIGVPPFDAQTHTHCRCMATAARHRDDCCSS